MSRLNKITEDNKSTRHETEAHNLSKRLSFCEMTPNIPERRTGLPFNIWISKKSQAKEKYPRLKIGQEGGDAAVTITEPILCKTGKVPRGGQRKLAKYIRLNREALLKYRELPDSEYDFQDYMQEQIQV